MLETVAAAASDAGHDLIIQMLNQATTNIYWFLGLAVTVGLTLVFGSYAYTWITTGKIFSRIDDLVKDVATLETNHLHDIQNRLTALEDQAKESK